MQPSTTIAFLILLLAALLAGASAVSEHKALFPMNDADVYAMVLAGAGLALAACGGIGGGGILVPLYMLVLGFSPKQAVPLSNVTVLGGAVMNTILNAPRRHPLADRPLIDIDIMMMMEPMTVVGAILGSYVNRLLPDELLKLLLLVFFIILSSRTTLKGCKRFKSESANQQRISREAREEKPEDFQETDAENKHADLQTNESSLNETSVRFEITNGKESADSKDTEEGRSVQAEDDRTKLLENMLTDERNVPLWKILVLCALMLATGAVTALQQTVLSCGSAGYWGSVTALICFVMGLGLVVRRYLLSQTMCKLRVGYRYCEGDVKWDVRATLLYPLLCTFAGVFAGLFGVGGGIVKGPLMLEMGVHPVVATATSATMILFTSTAATCTYWGLGELVPDYSIAFFLVALLSTLVGQLGVTALVARLHRPSLVVFAVAAVMVVSAALLGVETYANIADPGAYEFSTEICNS